MKKILLASFVLISWAILSSSSCNDEPVNVKWAEANLVPMQVIKDTNDNFNFSFIYNNPEDTSSVSIGEYGLLLDLRVDYLIAHFRRPQLIKSAYAFQFSTNYVLQNNVDSIRIITLRDFDNQHLKNSVMNDLILVRNGDVNSSIEHVIITNADLNYDDVTGMDGEGTQFQFRMFFTKDPDLDSLVQFVSHTYCSDNVVIIDTCHIVRIVK